MIALIAGLNQPAIRRLERTWEQVSQRSMALLEAVERTMDSSKGWANYHATLAKVTPPCVPFYGQRYYLGSDIVI
jgi:son of sevenless